MAQIFFFFLKPSTATLWKNILVRCMSLMHKDKLFEVNTYYFSDQSSQTRRFSSLTDVGKYLFGSLTWIDYKIKG